MPAIEVDPAYVKAGRSFKSTSTFSSTSGYVEEKRPTDYRTEAKSWRPIYPDTVSSVEQWNWNNRKVGVRFKTNRRPSPPKGGSSRQVQRQAATLLQSTWRGKLARERISKLSRKKSQLISENAVMGFQNAGLSAQLMSGDVESKTEAAGGLLHNRVKTKRNSKEATKLRQKIKYERAVQLQCWWRSCMTILELAKVRDAIHARGSAIEKLVQNMGDPVYGTQWFLPMRWDKNQPKVAAHVLVYEQGVQGSSSDYAMVFVLHCAYSLGQRKNVRCYKILGFDELKEVMKTLFMARQNVSQDAMQKWAKTGGLPPRKACIEWILERAELCILKGELEMRFEEVITGSRLRK